MKKKVISYFFIIVVTAFAAAPTLSMLSDSIDSAIFYSLNDEDTTTNENIKVFRVHSIERILCITFMKSEKKDLNTPLPILYAPVTTECLSPPPELV